MALKLNERYPGRFNNPSSGYPLGSFKNRTTPVSKDGSYLEQDWANDKEGFFQSLIAGAGITPSGAVDRVGLSQYMDALRFLIQQRSGSYASFRIAITNQLLALNSFHAVNASSLSLGLPALASTTAGDVVAVTARFDTLIAANGSENINSPAMSTSTTSILVRAGEQIVFIAGAGAWAVNAWTKNPQYQSYTAFTTAGTAAALTLTPIPAIPAYATPLRFRVNFSQASTPTSTINVSGLGARLLKQYDSAGAKVPAVYVASQLGDIEYDGTDWILLDQLPTDNGVSPGTVIYFAANAAPSGYLKANGTLVSRTTYARLFSVVGTTFGVGDGSTTFGLPDARANVIRGFDDARGVDSGRVFGSEQLDAFQGHFHDKPVGSTSFVGLVPGGGASQSPGNGTAFYTSTGAPVSDGSNGTPRTASETRMRNIALLACIKF